MKIEKVNDNQIRCTLTREDLADRQLKLSELAYGTDKAKSLFRDMMQQASYELGFEAEDIPLMIEAIPLSSESIILVITKVEYPDELDTRFSKFSDIGEPFDLSNTDDYSNVIAEGADDILGLFRKISDDKKAAENAKEGQSDIVPLKDTAKGAAKGDAADEDLNIPIDLTKLFVFHHMEDIMRLAHILKDFYDGDNTLYKSPKNHRYYLFLHKSSLTPEVFNKVCNILSEYAHQETITPSTEAFFLEHYPCISPNRALQIFADL